MGHHLAHQHTYYGGPQTDKKEKRGRKNIKKNNDPKHSKFHQRFESTHPRSSMNCKQDQLREIIPRYLVKSSKDKKR